MWIDGKFMTEPEIQVYIQQVKEGAFREGYLKAVDTMAQETAKEMSDLEKQRDAYKKELADWLRKACECVSGDDFDCSLCRFNDIGTNNGCPSKVNVYDAKLRLEELTKELAITHKTTIAIRDFSTDVERANSLLLLMEHYGVSNLASITENQGQEFLNKLRSGEITVR